MPFTGKSAREVMFKHITRAPAPPQTLNPEIPPAVSRLVLRMMAKRPQDRFATPEEFLAALGDLSRQHTLGDPAKSTGLALERPRLDRTPDAHSLFREGVEAARAGNKPRALSLLQASAELAPGHEEGWLWLASACDSPQAAVAALQRALALNPSNAHAAARLKTSRLHSAYAELKAGNKPAARRFLLAVLDSDRRHEQAWMGLAVVAETNAEVCHALEQVLEINPNNDKARRSLDEYRAALGPADGATCPMCHAPHPRPLAACPSCRAVLSLENPDEALRGRADPAVLARAIAAYDKAVARAPDFANHLYLGLAYLNSAGGLERALPHLAAASHLRPDDAPLADRVRHLRRRLAEGKTLDTTAPPPETLAALAAHAALAPLPVVLVIDDSPEIRKVLNLALSKSGYRVVEAADGPEGAAAGQTIRARASSCSTRPCRKWTATRSAAPCAPTGRRATPPWSCSPAGTASSTGCAPSGPAARASSASRARPVRCWRWCGSSARPPREGGTGPGPYRIIDEGTTGTPPLESSGIFGPGEGTG